MKKWFSAILILGIVATAGLLVRWDTLARELNETYCPQCSLAENASRIFSTLVTLELEPTPLPEIGGWISGETSVSRLSHDEQIRLLGVPLEVAEWETEQSQLEVNSLSSQTLVIPSEIDWRDKLGQDWTTPIRDQGGCGSCVAFATIAAIESRLEIMQANASLNPDLSENHLFFCGCSTCCLRGWWPNHALAFVRDTGIVDEPCDPYDDVNQTCSPCSDWQDRVTKIHRGEGTNSSDFAKWSIAEHGPVVVTMEIFSDFYFYTGGVYRHTEGILEGHHAVSLVGYNDSEGYWIGKNSWGEGWGEQGWFRIAYEEASIDDYFYIPILKGADPEVVCEGVSEIPEKECTALVELYSYTYGDEWNNNAGWLETKTPCNWYGVSCRDGHVRELNLASNSLRGKVPPAIADLQEIEGINISKNHLNGFIPQGLANLSQLQFLSLSNNNFSDRIPPELGQLSKLEELHLDNNNFEDSIPKELGELENLMIFRLNNNLLTSTIPSTFGQLSNLQEMDLKNNQIIGWIPDSFMNLDSLEVGKLHLDYLGLSTRNPSVRSFIDMKAPGWTDTQTVPPLDLRLTQITNDEVEVTWTPIHYTEDSGYYKISYESQNDDIEYFNTEDKTVSSIRIDGLMPGIWYDFYINTITPPHDDQRNMIQSSSNTAFIRLEEFDCNKAVGIPMEECLILLDLYENTQGLQWINKDGWVQNNNPCDWYGVHCMEGHVVGLLLPKNGLKGHFPTEILNLSNLTTLELQHNELTGSIPTAIDQPVNLRTINLSDNKLSGEIPVTIGNLINISGLWLDQNQLSGAIPPSIGNCAQLVELSINNNALIGEIPGSILNLVSLDNGLLDLGFNALTTSDPDLRTFLIRKDPDWAMSQTIPPTDLQAIVLENDDVQLAWSPIYYTQNTGWYEIWIAEGNSEFSLHGRTQDKTSSEYLLQNLNPGSDYRFKVRTFTAAHSPQQNELWSVFSEEAGNGGETFSCGDVTQIPVAECQALEVLYLSTNGPEWENNLDWLKTINLCSWYGVRCENGHVTSLQLRGNNLQGVLPSRIEDLTHLQRLDFSENQLSDQIPVEITHLNQLEILSLNMNSISGSLPVGLSNLVKLTSLQIGSNQLSGPFPSEICSMITLSTLDLSGNQLRGEIPVSLGNLINLKELWLNQNNFSGEIPASLGNLILLLKLNLTSNVLEGEIPATFLNLTNLHAGWLKLEYNALKTSDSALSNFLSEKSPNWWKTQTIAPSRLDIEPLSFDTLSLAWSPIPYTQGEGGYEIWIATEAEPFTVHGKTESKSNNWYLAEGLEPSVEYRFKIRTYSPSNGTFQKEIWSGFSEEIRFRLKPQPPDPTEQPDLISENLILEPGDPIVNEVLKITGMVKNVGTVSSNTSSAIFCVDNTVEACYEAQDGKVGTFFNVGPFDSGAFVQIHTYSWIPDTPGEHIVHLCADVTFSVSESNESATINCTSKKFSVIDTGQLSDLTIAAIDWPTTALLNDDVVFFYRVNNVGTGIAEWGYLNQLFIDGQLVLDQDIQVGTRTGRTMVPGGEESHGFVWHATCGTHQVTVKTDTEDQIAESDEDNNMAAAHTLTVTCEAD